MRKISQADFPALNADGGYAANVQQPTVRRARGVKVRLPATFLADLEREMEARGWTKDRLAKAAGISPPSVTRIFKNDTTDDKIGKVAAALALQDPSELAIARQHAEWLDLGARLYRSDRGEYRALLKKLRNLVDAAEAFLETKRALK